MACPLGVSLPYKLEPFEYQVGGHFVLMRLGLPGAVCKPSGKRETYFYHTVPEPLREFIPAYHGILSVDIQVDDSNEVQYIATRYYDSGSCDVNLESLVYFEDEREIFRCFNKPLGDMMMIAREQPIAFATGEEKRFHNPLSSARLQTLSKILKKHDKIRQHDYIVLEDLTSGFRYPCIIDLKLGTRCHGDLKDPDKNLKHLRRAKETTSLSLGVRFIGMLVYSSSDKLYRFYDKYINHEHLTEGHFFNYLKLFFFDGRDYHFDVIEELIKRLEKLRDIVSQLDTYRFFSTSLLLVYEGDKGAKRDRPGNGSIPTDDSNPKPFENPPPLVKARLIDFENLTQGHYTSDPIKYTGPDTGTMQGLTTLITFLQSILLQNTSTTTQQ